MATKKKGKKAMKSKRTSSKKVTTTRRVSKRGASKKLTAKKKAPSSASKALGTASSSQRDGTRRRNARQSAAFELKTGPRSAGQSGDLQGLRDDERADSESVGELLEEGNAFEAGVVGGVERAEDDKKREVHTHEVPEDDVPEEYLDKD
ncbi:MAG: hypothetical protein WCF61_07490 [Terriglobales bacterium]